MAKMLFIMIIYWVYVIPLLAQTRLVDSDGPILLTDGTSLLRIQRDNDGDAVDCTPDGSVHIYPESEDSFTYISKSTFQRLTKECRLLKDTASGPTKRAKRSFKFMIPGTKWCGHGKTATHYYDLGTERETDKCCRAHDHCPYYIMPFQEKYNVTNWSFFQMSHCSCEDKFRQCLHNSPSKLATVIGTFYFNVIQRRCFKKDYPRVCRRKGWWFTCKDSVIDKSKPKEMRIVSNSYY